MNIAVIGTGYVGLVTGTCFSSMGNSVWCVDVNEEKIRGLQRGIIPIYEPGLGEMVSSNLAADSLHFTTKLSDALEFAEVCFIAVGTPMGEDGSADMRYVLDAAEGIGRHMRRKMCVVDKSTVPVGTAGKVRAVIQEQLDKRKSDLTFHVVSNPEFLKEGTAVADCMKPDRIVLGVESAEAEKIMRRLYKPYFMNSDRLILMDVSSAEMTKYAANAMLASRISFMNEMAGLCERLGADIDAVRRGIGSDRRIGFSFIYPGCGYGGSCFPKDVQALIQMSTECGYPSPLLRAIETVNETQKHVLGGKVRQRFGEDLRERTFAVWGLTFKPDTDDMRESPAVAVVRDLIDSGAAVQAYDPKASKQGKEMYLRDCGPLIYCESKYDALKGADALVLATEWKEFRSPDFGEIRKLLKNPVIFDGRNQYEPKHMAELGFEYYRIGTRPLKAEQLEEE